jgi:hypothetical protein
MDLSELVRWFLSQTVHQPLVGLLVRFESIDALCHAKSDTSVPPLPAGFPLTGNHSQGRNLGSPPHGFPDEFLSVHDRVHESRLQPKAEMATSKRVKTVKTISLGEQARESVCHL